MPDHVPSPPATALITQPLPLNQPPPTPTTASPKPSSAPKKPRHRKQADPKPFHQSPIPQQNHSHISPPAIYSPRGPIYQPYHPHPYIMNPGYPINGSPFTQQQHPQSAYPPQPQQINSSSAPIPPHHPQYAYSMHAPPYAPHGYPPYPQYPQPMMMYAPPRPSAPQDPVPAAPSPMPITGAKRKRRSEPGRAKPGDKASDEEATTSDAARNQSVQQQSQVQALADLKKRTKTQRACDSCRSRKIRCDILADSEPPVCQHCKQYGFECTFFLPITETRFKKKKLEEEAADKEKAESSRSVSSPHAESSQTKRDIGVFGPTYPAHLLHSQASISSRIYENYDLRYNHKFEVSRSGDGLIQVQKPANDEQQLSLPKPVELHIERDVIESLINAYFTDIAPMLPVVTQAEFLATQNPPPMLLYSMCLVAAARREVPQKIFDSIRYAVNNIIKAEDVLSTASIVNVQALLILCMAGDGHSQFVSSALSALWIRLGSAIRMAQDLGLHRAESVKQDIELRRRLWGACLICDRWTSLAYGHPYMIDVQDCDARLPSSGDHNDLYLDELVRLSVILGRVMKTIYTPAGLIIATDEMLYQLLDDIENWKASLPEHLKFRGVDTPRDAGLLHFLYASVCMMFWRVFMRISYSCPAHLKFGLNVEQWSKLVTLTGEAIDWLDAHEHIYDVWLLVAYAATSCALVQYHTWARRKDEEAAAKLRKLRDCVRRWEGAISPDHMSARRKTSEIIALLYEATQGPSLPVEAPTLNPTGGVKPKQPVGLTYKKDPTRPGGGVFIAHGNAKGREEDFKDVPAGIIISGSLSDDGSEGEAALPPAAISSSASSAPANHNDLERTFFSSSSFAPPLPGDRSRHAPIVDSASYRRGMMTPVSAVRSPVGNGDNSRQQRQQPQSLPQGQGQGQGQNETPALVNFTPLPSGGRQSYGNVNPAMNQRAQSLQGNVQVMNVLDGPQGNETLQEFATVDTGFLEGIPGGMFDWGQWDTFFSRFAPNSTQGDGGGAQNIGTFQQQQPQPQQPQQQRMQQPSPMMQPISPVAQQSPMTQQSPETQNLPPRFVS